MTVKLRPAPVQGCPGVPCRNRPKNDCDVIVRRWLARRFGTALRRSEAHRRPPLPWSFANLLCLQFLTVLNNNAYRWLVTGYSGYSDRNERESAT